MLRLIESLIEKATACHGVQHGMWGDKEVRALKLSPGSTALFELGVHSSLEVTSPADALLTAGRFPTDYLGYDLSLKPASEIGLEIKRGKSWEPFYDCDGVAMVLVIAPSRLKPIPENREPRREPRSAWLRDA